MAAKEKFYITTPIYYINDRPHIGHIYTTIAADILARYHRLQDSDVFFLTGVDENSQKNVEAASKQGCENIQEYLDSMAEIWKTTFSKLLLSNDEFIRTTEKRHHLAVERFWQMVQKKGDIYIGNYEGLYCVGCECFKLEIDLVDGLCPLHKKAPEKIREKNYFFKLSAYRQQLLQHIDDHPEFIQPISRRNEVRSYVEKFMEDVSISREVNAVRCGIPVPGDNSQVIYVWFDALINYLTGVGFSSDEKMFKQYWPADVHLVGKDIIKFHCALWPAMLMSAGLSLPEKVFAHGFFTIDGEKMSKSLGNVIDPLAVAEKYGRDVLRFFLFKEISFGEDGDFSLQRLAERYQSDLGNDLGNLLHRTLSMTEKYLSGATLKSKKIIETTLQPDWTAYEQAMRNLNFGTALEVVWDVLRRSNKYIDEQKPWSLAKEDPESLPGVLFSLLEGLRHVAWLLKPFMPEIAEQIFVQLGIAEFEAKKTYKQAKIWGGFPESATIAKGEPLFPRLEE
jgi:methionyl-tRNA synthetase